MVVGRTDEFDDEAVKYSRRETGDAAESRLYRTTDRPYVAVTVDAFFDTVDT